MNNPFILMVPVPPDDPDYAEAVAIRDFVQAQFDAKSAEEWAAIYQTVQTDVLQELERTRWGLQPDQIGAKLDASDQV